MVERRPFTKFLTHAVLLLGVFVLAFPIWITFVASTHAPNDLASGVVPLWPGGLFLENYSLALGQGLAASGGVPVGRMLFNSLVMALSIASGKIAISLIAAYAIVYFRFPFRMLCFWTIFINRQRANSTVRL